MPAPTPAARPASTVQIALALGVLYVVWGSTYFGIRVAIDTLPPLLLCGVRYLTAGALLFAWSVRRGDREGDRLTPAHWLSALLIGGALLTIGNGGVAWSEQRVPSGIAALLVAMSPLWMALLNRLGFGVKLGPRVGAGIALAWRGSCCWPGPGAPTVSIRWGRRCCC